MTKPKDATSTGLDPHWKVRIVLPGALLHLASRTEPRIIDGIGHPAAVHADWINDHSYGDTLGHIHWPSVVAVTWRWAP